MILKNFVKFSHFVLTCALSLLFAAAAVFSSVSAEGGSVRALLYHNIVPGASDPDIPTEMSAAQFDAQMKWLYDNGYKTVCASDIFSGFNSGADFEKTVAITFDDGYVGMMEYALPILNKYGFVASAYLIANKIDTPKNLTGDDIRTLSEAGWEIGSHGMTHADLTAADDIHDEICGSRQMISAAAKIPLEEIASFAYPYGAANEVRNKNYSYNTGKGTTIICGGTFSFQTEA